LEPGKKYRLILVGGPDRQDLVAFNAGIGGTAIVQTFGPLKHVAIASQTAPAMKLEIRSEGSGIGDLVLEQAALKD